MPKKANKIERICLTCKEPFSPRPYQIKVGQGKWCSRSCYYASQQRPIEERFWEKVDRSGGPDACWPWIASSHRGYGQFFIRKQNSITIPMSSHRFSWELHYGPIPRGLCVLHRCDNPACVQPNHLFLGTHADNVEDKMIKGRHPKGEVHGSAKLTWNKVREIRTRYAKGGTSQDKLAIAYGVSQSLVGLIIRNKRWLE